MDGDNAGCLKCASQSNTCAFRLFLRRKIVDKFIKWRLELKERITFVHAESTHKLMFIKGTSINLWTEGTYEPHEIAQINKTENKEVWVMGAKMYGRRTKTAMRQGR
jgi:hypothetical protein